MAVLTMKPKAKTANEVAGNAPHPESCAGFDDYQAELTKLSNLSSQLNKLKEAIDQQPTRNEVTSALNETAGRFVDGELSMNDLARQPGFESRHAEQQRQLTIVQQAVVIQTGRMKQARGRWADEVVKASMPHYRKLAKDYVTHLVRAAKLAEEMQNIGDDIDRHCDKIIPELSRNLLGRLDDLSQESRISRIIAEYFDNGIIKSVAELEV